MDRTRLINVVCFILALLIVMLGCANQNATGHEDGPIPEEYKAVLTDYKRIVDFRLSDDFENDYNQGNFPSISKELSEQVFGSDKKSELSYHFMCMLADMTDYIEEPQIDSFGYVMKDLNEDQTPELIWVSSDYEVIFAIFTIKQGHATLLDAYWPKQKAVVLDSGEILTFTSDGVYHRYTCWEIDSALKVKYSFGREKDRYFEVTNNQTLYISKDRFEKALIAYPFCHSAAWRDNKMYVLQ